MSSNTINIYHGISLIFITNIELYNYCEPVSKAKGYRCLKNQTKGLLV